MISQIEEGLHRIVYCHAVDYFYFLPSDFRFPHLKPEDGTQFANFYKQGVLPLRVPLYKQAPESWKRTLKKETVNEKDHPEQLKHVATGTPVPSGPENDKKHLDDSAKPAGQLDHEAKKEFEQHNMSDHRGYNETATDVPVEKKNIAEDEQEAKKTNQ